MRWLPAKHSIIEALDNWGWTVYTPLCFNTCTQLPWKPEAWTLPCLLVPSAFLWPVFDRFVFLLSASCRESFQHVLHVTAVNTYIGWVVYLRNNAVSLHRLCSGFFMTSTLRWIPPSNLHSSLVPHMVFSQVDNASGIPVSASILLGTVSVVSHLILGYCVTAATTSKLYFWGWNTIGNLLNCTLIHSCNALLCTKWWTIHSYS